MRIPDLAPEPEPVTPPPSEEPSGKRAAGFATLGIGAALLVAGGVTGGVALAGYKRLDNDCTDNVCPVGGDHQETGDRARALALATDVLIPTGAVLGTVGIILLVLSRKKSAEKQVGLRPVLGPGQGGMLLEGRF